MNIFKQLNEVIDYIENNITDEISYEKLAQILYTNINTMKSIFSAICGMSVVEYIRKRRLSLAANELCVDNTTIMDTALKYGYENATAFSRAFANFHGAKPSAIKKGQNKIKSFPKFHFEIEEDKILKEIDYSIVDLKSFNIYGKAIKTDLANIGNVAPEFFKEQQEKYKHKGRANYGMVIYKDRKQSKDCEYVVGWDNQTDDLDEYVIPQSKWLSFKINSTDEKEIQATSRMFYSQFLPSNSFKIKSMPEIEYYHDGKTEFLVPIID